MRVLVTGATGFVGGWLVPDLQAAGHEVVAVVRTPGSAPAGAIEAVVESIDGTTRWEGLLDGVDAVVHLAARVHVMDDTATDPLAEFRRVNRDGTVHLARACVRHGVRRFVFLSSIKVNGESTASVPFAADSPLSPADPYGQSKAEAEEALTELASATDLEAVIVRTPLVYGPGVRGNFRTMMSIARRPIPLPFGSLRNRRSMTAVWNLTDALRFSIDTPAPSVTVLLASDATALSTGQLVAGLRSAFGVPGLIFPFPVSGLSRLARMTRRTEAVRRLTESLETRPGCTNDSWEWTPPYSTEQGLRWTVSGRAEAAAHGDAAG
ncbi:MAG: NAD-dependent epimerase/dehydratase family protein [Microcella sp.]|uniref:NAD-dependent epimerase/dehydratase family protein n=1 Tax=Microcella sp. TaxID=1913979 RepID=UPI00272003E2|nr:NAD-dependent epimerase/dehydratase family protein [Microcella sp.]MDO8337995.1 NAD-dependent epimerase/dehydratase family protein [Microcella sp.]